METTVPRTKRYVFFIQNPSLHAEILLVPAEVQVISASLAWFATTVHTSHAAVPEAYVPAGQVVDV